MVTRRKGLSGFGLVLMLVLSHFTFPAHAAPSQGALLTAQLDVLSTPTLARVGRVIWAGMSDRTPDGAGLAFILKSPAGAPDRVTTVPLTLTRGEVAERVYAFDTPTPGEWRVIAVATVIADGRAWTESAEVTFTVKRQMTPMSKTAASASLATGTPLTVDGPLVTSEITTPGEIKWFSFDTPFIGFLNFECIPGTLTNFEMSVQSGTVSWNPMTPAIVLNTGRGYSAYTYFFWNSTSYPWCLGIRAKAPQTMGTFSIHITSGPGTTLFINGGAKSTASRNVTLNIQCNSYASSLFSYIASESPDFIDASWQELGYNPQFTLSPGNGLKTVYVKTRDGNSHESVGIAATIALHAPIPVTVDGPAVSDRISASGEVVPYSFTITQKDRYRIYVQPVSGDSPVYPRLFISNTNGDFFYPSIQGNLYSLDPGNYVLKITSTGASRFSVRMARDHLTYSIAPDTPALTGTVSASDQLPWYIFNVPQQGHYTILIKTFSGGPALPRLYGPDSETRLITANPTVLAPGQYIIKVAPITTPCTYSIQVIYDKITMAINNGALVTSGRLVTLNNTVTGSPQSYMASLYPDFHDGVWLPYSPAPTFKLSAGNVLKTVYFKVRYAGIGESAMVTDNIILREIVGLPVGWTVTGNINPVGDVDWYQIVVPAGTYTIETRCGTLEDTVLELYDPASKLIARDDDSGVDFAARITVTLQAGTYYAKVTPAVTDETGSYTITVRKP